MSSHHSRNLPCNHVTAALKRRDDLKLIVMSATISTSKFSLYLGRSLGLRPALEPEGTAAAAAGAQVLGEQEAQELVSAPDGGVPVLFIPGYTFPGPPLCGMKYSYFVYPPPAHAVFLLIVLMFCCRANLPLPTRFTMGSLRFPALSSLMSL